MTSPLHPYLRLRARMTRQALLRIIPSLSSSLEILVLGFAPVLIGLLACVALPGLYAATLPWPRAMALVAAQALLATLPVWLLRKHLHPAEVTVWSRALPIGPRLRWGADALAAGLVVGPVGAAFAISTAIWLYQWPDWLRPVAPLAVALTALSLLLAWLLSTLLLGRRARMPAARKPGRARAVPSGYTPASFVSSAAPVSSALSTPPDARRGPPQPLSQRRSQRLWYALWHRLFWLPFWRGDDVVGIQQTLLLLGAMLSVAFWMAHPPLLPPALWGASSALTLMLLTDRGDKSVAEQIARLRPLAAAWPVDTTTLFRAAMLSSLLPGLCVLAWFGLLALGRAADGYNATVALVWLGVAAAAQGAVVGLRGLGARGRTTLVVGAIVLLTAIGSELWN